MYLSKIVYTQVITLVSLFVFWIISKPGKFNLCFPNVFFYLLMMLSCSYIDHFFFYVPQMFENEETKMAENVTISRFSYFYLILLNIDEMLNFLVKGMFYCRCFVVYGKKSFFGNFFFHHLLKIICKKAWLNLENLADFR